MDTISEISESQVEEYGDACLEELKFGKHKMKFSVEIFRCPFCQRKKKRDYICKEDMLQHATRVASSNIESYKNKANHRALAKFLENGSASVGVALEPAVESEPPIEQNRGLCKMEPLVSYPSSSEEDVEEVSGFPCAVKKRKMSPSIVEEGSCKRKKKGSESDGEGSDSEAGGDLQYVIADDRDDLSLSEEQENGSLETAAALSNIVWLSRMPKNFMMSQSKLFPDSDDIEEQVDIRAALKKMNIICGKHHNMVTDLKGIAEDIEEVAHMLFPAHFRVHFRRIRRHRRRSTNVVPGSL